MEEAGTLNGPQRYRRGVKIAINAALSVLVVALPAYADGAIDACDVVLRLSALVRVFGTILLITAFAAILYSALLFIVGGASEETLRKARIILIWSLVGLAVALLATLADDIMIQLLGPVETTCPKPPGF